jgi:hypothetical protein
MTPSAARRLLPLLVLALCPLTACGIPETGVVGAGEPATGIRVPAGSSVPSSAETAAAPAEPVTLYFVRNGSLVTAPRQAPAPAEPATAVLMLFKGPDEDERARGLTTELPRPRVAPTVRTDGATVTVELSPAAGPLNDTAVDQVACTAAAARLHQDPALGTVRVTVERPDGRPAGRSSDDCPGRRLAVPTAPPAPDY